jgi:hypothetical protein
MTLLPDPEGRGAVMEDRRYDRIDKRRDSMNLRLLLEGENRVLHKENA